MEGRSAEGLADRPPRGAPRGTLTGAGLKGWQHGHEHVVQEEGAAVHPDGAGQQAAEVADVPAGVGAGCVCDVSPSPGGPSVSSLLSTPLPSLARPALPSTPLPSPSSPESPSSRLTSTLCRLKGLRLLAPPQPALPPSPLLPMTRWAPTVLQVCLSHKLRESRDRVGPEFSAQALCPAGVLLQRATLGLGGHGPRGSRGPAPPRLLTGAGRAAAPRPPCPRRTSSW